MQLIVGLGNIGEKYAATRHNIGFLAVDQLAEMHKFSSWKEEKKFFGSVATGMIGGEKTLLLKPNTYMNLSGKSIQAVRSFYKISAENVFLWHDDIDLDFGKIRWREKGGSGGHNGLKSIFQAVGTQDLSRLKFGVKNELREKISAEKFVLANFTAEERNQIPEFIASGIELFRSHLS